MFKVGDRVVAHHQGWSDGKAGTVTRVKTGQWFFPVIVQLDCEPPGCTIGFRERELRVVTPPPASEVNERLATEVDVRSYLEVHPFEPFVYALGFDGEDGVFFAKDTAVYDGVPGVRYAGLL